VPLPFGKRRRGRARALSGKARRAAPPAGGALRDFEIHALPQSSSTSRSEGGRPGVTARGRRWASLVALALAFAGLYARVLTALPPRGFAPPQTAALAAPAARPRYEAQLLPNTSAASVHSATAAEISGGRLRAFWYGGSREGASDVAIYTSVYSLRQKDWSPERAVVTREFAQRHLRRSVR